MFQLDKPAFDLLTEFFEEFPELVEEEFEEHGFDPLSDPDMYFEVELLTEPWHRSVLKKVIKNRRVVTRPMVEEWIKQELYEKEYK